MNSNGKRLKGLRIATLLLALGFTGFQGNSAQAFFSDESGEATLGFTDNQGGELPKNPGGNGGGAGDPTRRADPDDLSFNNPRENTPVVAVPNPAAAPTARQGWVGILRFWLEHLMAQLIQLHR